MAPLRVLITGAPGVGKTTLVDKVAKDVPAGAISGFLGHERRDAAGNRAGFELVTLDGARCATLATTEPGAKTKRMGKYHVHVKDLEDLTFPILDAALAGGDEPRAVLFDEIGKMELFSQGFVDRVRRLLASPDEHLHVVGTVALRGDAFIAESKRIPGVEVIEIDRSCRGAQAAAVSARLCEALAVSAADGGTSTPTDAAAAGGKRSRRRWAPVEAGRGTDTAAGVDVDAPAVAAASAASSASAKEAMAQPADGSLAVCFDQPGPGKFSAAYLERPAANFASLNAGDYHLYVGGAAINKAFFTALEDCGHKPKKRYEALHEALLASATFAPGVLQWVGPGDVDNGVLEDCIAFSGLVPAGERFRQLSPVGLVSVAVFPEQRRPLHSTRNVAMVYAVGPNCGNTRKKGRREVDNMTKAEFLEVMQEVGDAIACSVRQYNEAADAGPLAAAPAAAEAVAAAVPLAVVRRVDPEDDVERSLAEAEEHYRKRYKPDDIKYYWNHNCRPSRPRPTGPSRPPAGLRLPRLDILRVCLLSGGVYKHKDASKVEVASALIRGLVVGGPSPAMPLLDFAFDEDCFREAWRGLGLPEPTGGRAVADE